MSRLSLAIPNKGRMAAKIRDLLVEAGYPLDERASARGLRASAGEHVSVLLVRAADIPGLVADGVADAGVTGLDLVAESGRHLEVLLDLGIGACELVAAAPEHRGYPTTAAVPQGARVATSFPRLAAQHFRASGVEVEIVPVSGASEVMPHLGVADIVVDITATGETLRTNGLRPFATLMRSTACVVTAKPASDDLTELVGALDSVLQAQEQRYIMANVPAEVISRIEEILPGMNGPTVTTIIGDDTRRAVHAVVHRRHVTTTLAGLKRIGAEAILVTRIERLVP